jgi:dynein heavy chain 2
VFISVGLGDQTYQLIREYQKYKDIVKRPVISKELAQERETLLGQLNTFLSKTRDDFETRSKQVVSGNASSSTDDKPLSGRNLPEIVNNLVWARQIQSKVEHIVSTAQVSLDYN